MSLPPSASDTTRLRGQRVLYADKVIQETDLQAGLRNAIRLDGGVQGKGAAAASLYIKSEAGRIETTEAERESYVASVPIPIVPDDPVVPDAPTNLTTLIGNSKIILFFDAPTNTTVDEYTVTSSPDGIVATGSSSPIIVSSITNGTPYTLSITASNVVGTSGAAITDPIDTTYTFTTTSFTTVGASTWNAPAYVTTVEYLVVGGGGGGGNGYDTGGGGGGGAGMVLSGNTAVISGSTYSINVGAGGAGGAGGISNRTNLPGFSGISSEFNGITALGGGGGGGSRTQDQTPGGYGVGGLAQNGSISAALGGNGGGSTGGGAGGGGASAPGNDRPSASIGGTGGSGISSSISGSAITYGVGGNGANGNTLITGANGTNNRGNGGGAGSAGPGNAGAGGRGGSGIVILKY